MGAPNNLVFVRHGQSEANVIQQADKEENSDLQLPDELYRRPDWMHRLTEKGVEQAQAAGKWLVEHVGPPELYFDALYCSQFIRARETASYLTGPDVLWRPHNMIYERDWGVFGAVPRAEQAERFPYTAAMKKLAPLFVQLDGGEALASSVSLRMRSFKDTLFTKWDGKNVITVTHGDVMRVARFVFEEMLPEEWHEMDSDKSQDIGNCAIMWYTRTNPEDAGDVRPYLNWRRMIQPDDLEASPFGGEWQEVTRSRIMSAAALRASVEAVPRLIQ